MASTSSHITATIEEDTTSTSSTDIETTLAAPPPPSIEAHLEANYDAICNRGVTLYDCLLNFAETNAGTHGEFFRGFLPRFNKSDHLGQIFPENIFTYFSGIDTFFEYKILLSKLAYIEQIVNQFRAKHFISLINNEAFTDADKKTHISNWISLFNFFKNRSFKFELERTDGHQDYVSLGDLNTRLHHKEKFCFLQIVNLTDLIIDLKKINKEKLQEDLNNIVFANYLSEIDFEEFNKHLALFQQKHDEFMADNISVEQILQILTAPSTESTSSTLITSSSSHIPHLHYREKLNQLLLNLIQPLTTTYTGMSASSTEESMLSLINKSINSQAEFFTSRKDEYLFIKRIFIESLLEKYKQCITLLNQFIYQDIAPEILNEFRQCFYQHLAECFPYLDNTIKSLSVLKPTTPIDISRTVTSPPAIPKLNLSSLSATTSPPSSRKNNVFVPKFLTKLPSPRTGNKSEKARKSTSTPSFSASSPIPIPLIETNRPKSEPASSSTFSPPTQNITMTLVSYAGLSITGHDQPRSPRQRSEGSTSYSFDEWCEKFIEFCRPTMFDESSRSRLEVLLVKFFQSKHIHMGDYKNLNIHINKVDIPDIFYRFDLELAHFTICNFMRLPHTTVYSSLSSTYPPSSPLADMNSPRLGTSPLILLPSHSPPSTEPPIFLPPGLLPKPKP